MNATFARATLRTGENIQMTFEQFKASLILGLAAMLVSICGFMASSLWSLNEKMAVIVERVTAHAEIMRRHDIEIRDLQDGQRHPDRNPERYNLGPEKEPR